MRDVSHHIGEAIQDQPEATSIRSSIPKSLYAAEKAVEESKQKANEARMDAEKAGDEAESARESVSRLSIGSFITAVLGFVTLTSVVAMFFFEVLSLRDKLERQQERISSQMQLIEEQERRLDQQQEIISDFRETDRRE